MKVQSKGIEIHLEQNEIMDLWNIIMFAMDYHQKDSCMTDSEVALAEELTDILDKLK